MGTPVSAQVLLATAADPAGEAARARRAFTALGFGCGALVGGSFAIEAGSEVFEAVFGVGLQPREDGGIAVHEQGVRRPDGELPLAKLPPTLRPLVRAVLFTEPPAFGPGAY